MARSKSGDGSQAVRRAVTLLRELAAMRGSGVRLQQLATQSRLAPPTVHRILKGLIAEGLVAKDESTSRYSLGPVIHELGLAAAPRYEVGARFHAALDRLAAESGDTVFLSIRSHLDAVCIDRREGSYPIKALTLEIGSRRPLGVGAGALALLMALPESEAEDMIAANAHRFPAYNLTPALVREAVAAARANGYTLNDGRIIRAYHGLGVPIRGARGEVVAALSIAGISERISEARRPKLIALLRQEAARVEQELAAGRSSVARS